MRRRGGRPGGDRSGCTRGIAKLHALWPPPLQFESPPPPPPSALPSSSPLEDPRDYDDLLRRSLQCLPNPTPYRAHLALLRAEAGWGHRRACVFLTAAHNARIQAAYAANEQQRGPLDPYSHQYLAYHHLHSFPAFPLLRRIADHHLVRALQSSALINPSHAFLPRIGQLTTPFPPASVPPDPRSPDPSWGFARAARALPEAWHRRALRFANDLSAGVQDPTLRALVHSLLYHGEWRRYIDRLEVRLLRYALWLFDDDHLQAASWLIRQTSAIEQLNHFEE